MSELKNARANPNAPKTIVRDAAIVAALSTLVALSVNAVRTEGIPLVQQEEYDILVPCPEPVGDPEEMAASDPRIESDKSLLLDVRSKEEFAEWHVSGARNQPFDWLGPPVDKEVKTVAKQVAASRAHRVIVYGDGDNPDSGREWAKLLSGARIKNVFYVKGGAPALNPKLPKPEGLDLPPLEEVDVAGEPAATSEPADSAGAPGGADAPAQHDAGEETP
ncbi:MAG: rhodanese-like domain-containing protein [Myxococcota bacterium]